MGLFSKLFGQSGEEKAAAPENKIYAPVTGEAVPINQVSDPTFGEEIIGKGIAIKPTEGKVFAPCDGKVDTMFETGHAMTLVSDLGAEILIHVGLDTVNLKGQHFKIIAKSGERVKKGQLLLEFDKDAIIAAGYDVITPVVICNTPDYAAIETHVGKPVTAEDVVMELKK